MQVIEYQIIENKKVSHNYFKLTLDISGNANVPIPGQFYSIRCGKTKEPLLRRPFSMHRLIRRQGSVFLEILYRVIGKGTEWLSRAQRGESLDMIGPLGNGFIIENSVENVVLVSRGIGIAPLYAVGEEVRMRNRGANISILTGARTKERIFYEKECSELGGVFFYTDDGSRGFRGRAPDLLRHLLKQRKLPKSFSLYACGPPEMLRELSEISERIGFDGQVALEEHMGCGFGVCLSCACPLRPEYIKRDKHWKKPALQWSEDGSLVYSLICKDGPVYDIQEVNWDEWLA